MNAKTSIPDKAYKPSVKQECKHCKSSENTTVQSTNKKSIKRIYCNECRKWSTLLGAPKVLVFDIEVSQEIFKSWRTGRQYLRWQQVQASWYVISWAAKWLFSDESFTGCVTSKEAIARDDKRVVSGIWKMMDDADYVITQNGDRFDIRKLNWRFLKHGLPPNNRYTSIDILKKNRQVFGADSLALDSIAQELGYSGKHHTDIDLWNNCEAGDVKSLKAMTEYNRNDIFMTEDVYLHCRPWYKTHPHFALLVDMYQPLEEDDARCPRCLQTISGLKFDRLARKPSGYVYKTCNCPHCGCVVYKSQREEKQIMTVK